MSDKAFPPQNTGNNLGRLDPIGELLKDDQTGKFYYTNGAGVTTEFPAGTGGLGYKVYQAALNQSGALSAPVATVYVNTLGGDVTYSYNGVGTYTITGTGLFTDAKSFIIFSASYGNVNPIATSVVYEAGFNDEDSIYLSTGTRNNTTGATTLANGWLFNTLIEIRVYN